MLLPRSLSRNQSQKSSPRLRLFVKISSVIFQLKYQCLIQQVLFPLLTKLLENISPADVGGMEETRMRASTLLSKVSLLLLSESSRESMCIKRTKLFVSQHLQPGWVAFC